MSEIIFWGLCVVLLALPLPYGADVPWAVFVFECATFILALLHWMRRLQGEEAFGKNRFPLFLKACLWIFIAVSAFQFIPLSSAVLRFISPRTAAIYGELGVEGWRPLSFAGWLSLSDIVKYLFFFLFAFLVFHHVRTRKRANIFGIVLLASGVFQAFYGLLEYFGGTEKIFNFKRSYHLGSATGTYINRDHFSGLLEMLFPLALGFLLARANFFSLKKGLSLKEKMVWFSQERLQKTIIFGMIAIIIGLGIVFSRSRSGIFIFFGTVLLTAVALATGGPERRPVRLIRTVAWIVVFAAIMLGIRPVIERFTSQNLVKESRFTYYGNTLKYISSFPLTGTGLHSFVQIYPIFESKYEAGILDHAHNDYLEVLAESGVVGGGALIVFSFAGVGWIFAKWVKRKDPFVRGIVLGSLIGVIALLLHSFMDFNLRIPANAVYFMSLFAFAARVVDIRNEE